jgi:GTP-binding protein
MAGTLPVFALVGRPNVGKSTLFNRLTATRAALVADLPGLTRDRQYGRGEFEARRFIVIDTGGLEPALGDAVAALAEQQAQLAIEEADVVLFLVDAVQGLLPSDSDIAAALRRSGKSVRVLANKAEGMPKSSIADFFRLGLGTPLTVSAQHGDGILPLMRDLLDGFPKATAPAEDAHSDAIRVAVVGRPNAGKSTLVNRLVGEARVLSSEQPGTTRDAIQVPFLWDDQPFVLIDTAGIRRRSKTTETIEKFSIVKALEAIDSADVVIAMIDAHNEIGAHDARLMGLVAHHGRAMVLAVNKWDGLEGDERRSVKDIVNYRLPFLDFVPLHFVSALHGSGLRELIEDVIRVHAAVRRDLPTPELNKVLEAAVERHAPPAIVGRRIKLRYANQIGRNPPAILIHGNQTDRLPAVYKRYLTNVFREAFDLTGVPLRLEFRTGDNPFKGRRNELTPRQHKKRKRMMSHTRH